MKNTLELKNPILINGDEIKELSYDSNEITGALLAEADAMHRNSLGKKASATPVAELDYGLHLYLGFAAIIAVNPEIGFSDLERIKGYDTLEVMRIGRNFILRTDSPEENSTSELSESTADDTTQA